MFSSVGSKSSANPIHNKSLPRVLNLEVVEARSLIALNKNGTSDPYVTLSLLDLGGRPVKGESFKTAQKSGTLTPVWNDKFSFGNELVFTLFADLYFSLFVGFYKQEMFTILMLTITFLQCSWNCFIKAN